MAQAAGSRYQHAADLLDPGLFESLDPEVRNRILADREHALAQVASMEFYARDSQDKMDLAGKVESTEREIHHLKKAVEYLSLSNTQDQDLLARLQRSLQFAQGRKATMSARIAGREGRFVEARDLYRTAEGEFRQIVEMYEDQIPELMSIRTHAENCLDKGWSSNDDLEIDGFRASMLILALNEAHSPLSDEDLYRRAAANYYSNIAARRNLDAFVILNSGGIPQDAEKCLEDSIRFIYFAMDIFHGNLEFHRDLINAWRVRGELFGCPLEESDNYFHTRCPIAIIHFIKYWYASPTLEYESLACTVCDRDILDCPHYPGQVIDDQVVSYQRKNPYISSVSLVDVPKDPRCRVEWLSIPKKNLPARLNSGGETRCYICQLEKSEASATVEIVG